MYDIVSSELLWTRNSNPAGSPGAIRKMLLENDLCSSLRVVWALLLGGASTDANHQPLRE